MVLSAADAQPAAMDRNTLLKDADRADYSGNVDKSTEIYEKIVQENPNDSAALMSLGVNYGKKGDWDSAIKHLNKVSVIEPKNIEALIDLSLAYAEKGDYDRAIVTA